MSVQEKVIIQCSLPEIKIEINLLGMPTGVKGFHGDGQPLEVLSILT
jgi:hypothetical protein